jgi:hypothetical protein
MSGYELWPTGDDAMPALGDPDDDYEPVEIMMERQRQERIAAGLPDIAAGPAILYEPGDCEYSEQEK